MIVSSDHERAELQLRDVSQLRPHEETVVRLSDTLVERMISEAVQRDPIIVDDKTNVVLDGMHRLQVLRKIGVQKAVCNVLDYENDNVKLLRWMRIARRPSHSLLGRLLTELELKRGPQMKIGTFAKIGIRYGGLWYVTENDADAAQAFAAMRRFDKIVEEEGARVEFLDEKELVRDRPGAGMAMLVTPKIQKKDVIDAGVTGNLLPPKSTLHVFPIRPVGVDYPIADLRKGRDNLDDLLASRTPRVIESPATHNGRVYREPLLAFD